MKFIKIVIFIFCFIGYGYITYKASIESGNIIWGYACAFMFAVMFAWLVIIFTKHQKKKEENL
jgi:quinol-cytochrome oxidoreductase complex cytochrome b subunit